MGEPGEHGTARGGGSSSRSCTQSVLPLTVQRPGAHASHTTPGPPLNYLYRLSVEDGPGTDRHGRPPLSGAGKAYYGLGVHDPPLTSRFTPTTLTAVKHVCGISGPGTVTCKQSALLVVELGSNTPRTSPEQKLAV